MKLFQNHHRSERFSDIDDLRVFGARRWKPEFFAHYEHVSNINVDDLDVAFAVHNARGAGMFKKSLVNNCEVVHNFNPCHSMSVGDILEHDGKYFMVDPDGLEKVEVQ